MANNFLKDLAEELKITNPISTAILASLVRGTLHLNQCGINGDNMEEVDKILKESCSDLYMYEVAMLAGDWDNDLLDILCRHEPHLSADTFYTEHVWPYLRNHEIVPGVRMR